MNSDSNVSKPTEKELQSSSSSFLGMQDLVSNAFGSFSSLKNYFGGSSSSAFPHSPISHGKKKCKLCSNPIEGFAREDPFSCVHYFCKKCIEALQTGGMQSPDMNCPICEQKKNVVDSILEEVENTEEDQFLSKSFVQVPLSQKNQKEEHENSLRSSYEDGFVIIDEPVANILPSAYVPFSLKKEHCKPKTEGWLKNLWFVPFDLDENMKIQDFHGFYIPFYSFNITTRTNYSAQIHIKSKSEQEEISGFLSSEFENLLVCGSCALKPKYETQVMKLIRQSGSFTIDSSKIPPPEALSYSTDINLPETILPVEMDFTEAYKTNARIVIYQKEQENIKQEILTKYNASTKDLSMKVELLKFQFSITLLPIYLGSFSYHKDSYEIVISGNKGSIRGTYPKGSGRFLKYCQDAYQYVTKEEKTT